LTAFDRQFLHQFGLSLSFLAAYQVMLDAVSVLVCCALGALIFWRKSADRMALFCAFCSLRALYEVYQAPSVIPVGAQFIGAAPIYRPE